MTLGTKLIEMRQARGFTQAVMADRGGLSQGYLSQLENDEVVNPAAVVILGLANGLSLDPSVLFAAAGLGIPNEGLPGFLLIPVDLDLLTFCSQFSLKRQGGLLTYLSLDYDSPPETYPEVLKAITATKKRINSKDSGKKIGEKIRELREQQGLTQGQLAREADLSQGYLSQLEMGEVKNPSASVLFQIARALKIDVNVLFVAAGYKTARELENTYLQLCSKVLPELVGFFAQFPAEIQLRLLSHLKGMENLLKASSKQPVSA